MNLTIKSRNGDAGLTLMETLVAVGIITVLAAIAIPVSQSFKQRAHRVQSVEKLRSLGTALVSYTGDHSGNLPWEDASGTDDWQAVAHPDNADVWYNALPKLIGSASAASLAKNPQQFYTDRYPLYLPGAPYPSGDKRLGMPYFAVAMNSRLQRKNADGIKLPGTLSAIEVPHRTVIFLERGMPGDKKSNPGQRGFDASPKANARAFVARYNNKGLLICTDGHVEMRAVSELISTSGNVVTPQVDMVWTNDPDDDPN